MAPAPLAQLRRLMRRSSADPSGVHAAAERNSRGARAAPIAAAYGVAAACEIAAAHAVAAAHGVALGRRRQCDRPCPYGVTAAHWVSDAHAIDAALGMAAALAAHEIAAQELRKSRARATCGKRGVVAPERLPSGRVATWHDAAARSSNEASILLLQREASKSGTGNERCAPPEYRHPTSQLPPDTSKIFLRLPNRSCSVAQDDLQRGRAPPSTLGLTSQRGKWHINTVRT